MEGPLQAYPALKILYVWHRTITETPMVHCTLNDLICRHKHVKNVLVQHLGELLGVASRSQKNCSSPESTLGKVAESAKEGLACVSLCRKTIHLLLAVQAGRLCFVPYSSSSRTSFSNISPGTKFAGHVNPTHTLTSGLSPFPKNSNRHVDHDHDYYDLNQKPNRHFTTSLTSPNCPTDPSQRPTGRLVRASAQKPRPGDFESCW